jgi:hypothetical protein
MNHKKLKIKKNLILYRIPYKAFLKFSKTKTCSVRKKTFQKHIILVSKYNFENKYFKITLAKMHRKLLPNLTLDIA